MVPTTADRRAVTVLVALAVAFGLATGYYELLGLHEIHMQLGYDDGVWFGSAVRIANGFLPYRSFVMDQPPGVPLLMAPFGLLSRSIGTRGAFGVARLAMPLFQGITVLAVGRLLRHRGRLAVGIGCGLVAVYPEALLDQRTVMLEPICAMFCMLGLLGVLSGDRFADRCGPLILGGVAFGLAGSCKAFAVLPFAVVVAGLMVAHDRRRRVPLVLAGAVGAFVVVCGPFAVLAPSQFVHQVIVTQLVRSQAAGPGLAGNISSLIGVVPHLTDRVGAGDDARVAVAVVGLALVVLAGTVVARSRRRHAPLDAVVVGTVVVTAVGILSPPAYYSHYSTFFAPFLGLLVGLAAANIGLRLPRAIAVVAVAGLVSGAVHAVSFVRANGGITPDVAYIQSVIPSGACALTDLPPQLLLSDRFTSTVVGCAPLVDSFGTTLSADGGHPAGSEQADAPPTVGTWLRALRRAQYLVIAMGLTSLRIPWQSPRLRSYLHRNFGPPPIGQPPVDGSNPGQLIYVRRRTPTVP